MTVFALGGSLLLYRITDAIIPMRVSAEDEELGLDLSQHGETLDGGLTAGGSVPPASATGEGKRADEQGKGEISGLSLA